MQYKRYVVELFNKSAVHYAIYCRPQLFITGEVNQAFGKIVVEKSDFVTDDEKMVHHKKEVNQTPEEAEEEEVILTKLREVVRKSTHSDPTQRPTAEELLEILKR
ncbi:hypothetical protein SNE40_023417 [Patella caerulea]|uniref:Uncharacterized protein n=1 Tax=Patella caerulea TaxID=87958 RepID=A0AAN8FYF7_PATCE